MSSENNQKPTNDQEVKPFDPVQNMSYDVYRIYQDYWKNQQKIWIECWTQIIKNTYNPWKK